MKASLTLEFDSPAGLYAAVDRLRGKDVAAPIEVTITREADGTALMGQNPAEKTRKPRADAGKPRGPYKTSTTGEPAASEPGPTGLSGPVPPVAPVSPTTTAAPSSAEAQAKKADKAADQLTSAAATLTLDDAKAALRRVKDTKGLGTPACIGLIQSFGFDRISDLPAEKFPELLRQVDAMIAKQAAAK